MKISDEVARIHELDGVMIKEHPGSDICLFSFGSVGDRGGIIVPGFEFIKTTKELAAHRIFFRDIGASFYVTGLQKHCTTLAGIGDVIQKILDQYQPKKTVFVSNSGGSVPAQFFGNWFKVNGVLSLVPTTFFTQELQEKYNDRRVPKIAKKTRNLISKQKLHPGFNGVFFDYNQIPINPTTEFELHFDKNYLGDVIHAEEFPSGPNIRKIGWEFNGDYQSSGPHKGHHVDKELKRRGKLVKVFTDFFNRVTNY